MQKTAKYCKTRAGGALRGGREGRGEREALGAKKRERLREQAGDTCSGDQPERAEKSEHFRKRYEAQKGPKTSKNIKTWHF